MTTELDTELIPAVFDCIEEFGKSISFVTETTPGVYSALTGETTGEVESTVVRKVTPPEAANERFIDGDVVKRGDLVTFVAAKDLTFTVINGMKILFDGDTFKVVQVTKIYSGDDVALIQIFIRR